MKNKQTDYLVFIHHGKEEFDSRTRKGFEEFEKGLRKKNRFL